MHKSSIQTFEVQIRVSVSQCFKTPGFRITSEHRIAELIRVACPLSSQSEANR
ncbi:hypothetical protein BIW11_06167 [Tropilaelaps mercedesae]|uniref:Uncharacterized protein n=1 Tax=Tropilaelaps mercedesae TaxID=418985 RepID=A0A1V9XZC5_9ACAR|nr:hypothetical protein BIW11_06167 [Tropilaelaps mercedesae]